MRKRNRNNFIDGDGFSSTSFLEVLVDLNLDALGNLEINLALPGKGGDFLVTDVKLEGNSAKRKVLR